jgi:hypothetical protein
MLSTATVAMWAICINLQSRIKAYLLKKRNAARCRRLAALHRSANHPWDRSPALPVPSNEFLERHRPVHLWDRRLASPKEVLGILVPGKYEK